ncbi:MAG: aromatic amino acid lyase [Clostridia bacterium]|nr:aromatic amino acid lyase [Clostridia bacterium]
MTQFEEIDGKALNLVMLGNPVTIEHLVAIARHGASVGFSQKYTERVEASRSLVEGWIEEGRVMYGITTGFGALSTKVISKAETEQLQENIILSHAVSVGAPLEVEQVRAIMVCMLQSMGQGYSGVRMALLHKIKDFLNVGITPYAPGDGSVGYLSVEGHIGLALIGKGRVYYQNRLMETKEALQIAKVAPIRLAAKEGLALISGTTSPTALAALAIYDMVRATKTADVIGAMCLEVTKGTLKAFDSRLMQVKPYEEQSSVAANVRKVLFDSEIAKGHMDYRLQDALSVRAIPQLHGAARRTLLHSYKTIEEELNYTGDNPIIWRNVEDELASEAMSGCHCDASYVGLAMDSACIAATMLAKMSERRNYRLTTSTHSEMPWFLIKNPGINSGLMIPQYTQAGLLNEMKMMSASAVVDSVPTCGGQEDYVSMGYNACKKSVKVAEKLEYILAIELLSVYQAHQFMDGMKPGSAVQALLNDIATEVPPIEVDTQLHPYIEVLKTMMHSGRVIDVVEKVIGKLE